METENGWVSPPTKASGLDHLGVQAPCIHIYGTLLPGITNVTDRARYYSFYPWFFWAYNNINKIIDPEDVVEKFRRADCLFTLIAERHARVTDNNVEHHSISMVGRDTLVPALNSLTNNKSTLSLSQFATRDPDSGNRYFKNKYGGLGQYYFGPFQDLGLFVGDRKIAPKFTKEVALPIAEAVDKGINRKLFFEIIEKDVVTLRELDDLKKFCPCQLQGSKQEHESLINLIFDEGNLYGADSEQRKMTLGLILQLIKDNSSISRNLEFNQNLFRASVYSGSIDGKTHWNVPDYFKLTQQKWAIYQNNELLSIALQGIFWVALDTLANSDIQIYSVEEFMNWFSECDCVKDAIGTKGGKKVGNIVDDAIKKLPSLTAWPQSNHEICLGQAIRDSYLFRKKSPPHAKIIKYAMDLVIALAARSNQKDDPYKIFYFPEGYFDNYRLNLSHFHRYMSGDWSNFSLRDLLRWLAGRWGIETHLRVALRKLNHEHLDTFQIRPTEKGLKVINAPEPIFTSPRFKQATQILKDLRIIEENNGDTFLTDLGHSILGKICGR